MGLAACNNGGEEAEGPGNGVTTTAPGLAAGQEQDELFNPNDEYVMLSIVTQVPFWVDHKQALEDFSAETGSTTEFIGPPDFNVEAQAQQLDELTARRPAGIMLFLGDVDALTPGINRAVDEEIPVITIISDAPESKRLAHFGIDGRAAGRVGARLLADAIGGEGEVILGTFPAPNVLERVEGYKEEFAENYPDIEVVEEVNDRADPSFAPEAYAAAISANPNVVGIGGTDGDSGLGAARAVKEAGREGEIKIAAFDRNDDMLAELDAGTIEATVVQKSYTEAWLAAWMLWWLNHNLLNPVPDFRSAGINPLPEQITTGIWTVTQENVSQFFHN